MEIGRSRITDAPLCSQNALALIATIGKVDSKFARGSETLQSQRLGMVLSVAGFSVSVAALLGLGSNGFDGWEWSAVALTACVFAAVLTYLGAQLYDALSTRIAVDDHYSVTPATLRDAEAIHKIAVDRLGSQVSDESRIRDLICHNSDIFYVLVRKSGYATQSVCGYFCIFPLTESCVRRAEAGNFDVNRVKLDNFPKRGATFHSLYVGAIAGVSGSVHSRLVWALKGKVETMACSATSRTVYARAATPIGLRLVKSFKLEPVQEAQPRLGTLYRGKYIGE